MIDDQDRCEWVNVSSGTGSSGRSVQNPKIHKTVVCVSVYCPLLFRNDRTFQIISSVGCFMFTSCIQLVIPSG